MKTCFCDNFTDKVVCQESISKMALTANLKFHPAALESLNQIIHGNMKGMNSYFIFPENHIQ